MLHNFMIYDICGVMLILNGPRIKTKKKIKNLHMNAKFTYWIIYNGTIFILFWHILDVGCISLTLSVNVKHGFFLTRSWRTFDFFSGFLKLKIKSIWYIAIIYVLSDNDKLKLHHLRFFPLENCFNWTLNLTGSDFDFVLFYIL